MFIILLQYVQSSVIDQFVNNDTTGVLNFSSGTILISKNLSFSKSSKISSAYITLNLSSLPVCKQTNISANLTCNASDGQFSVLNFDLGNKWLRAGINLTDNNFSTLDQAQALQGARYNINFSKPDYAINTSYWWIRVGLDPTKAITLPTACWNQDPVQFRATSSDVGMKLYCRNSSRYNGYYDNMTLLLSLGDKSFYEDSMFWITKWLTNFSTQQTGINTSRNVSYNSSTIIPLNVTQLQSCVDLCSDNVSDHCLCTLNFSLFFPQPMHFYYSSINVTFTKKLHMIFTENTDIIMQHNNGTKTYLNNLSILIDRSSIPDGKVIVNFGKSGSETKQRFEFDEDYLEDNVTLLVLQDPVVDYWIHTTDRSLAPLENAIVSYYQVNTSWDPQTYKLTNRIMTFA